MLNANKVVNHASEKLSTLMLRKVPEQDMSSAGEEGFLSTAWLKFYFVATQFVFS